MRCEECRDLLRSLVDGGLDRDRRRDVGLHLAGCPACSELAGQDGFWDDALLRHLDHELPPDLRAGILGDLAGVEVGAAEAASRLDRLDRLDRRSRWRLVVWAVTRDFVEPARLLRTVAVVAVALLAVWWWTGERDARPEPFTEAAPILSADPAAAAAQYENPPTGRLSLSGRMI